MSNNATISEGQIIAGPFFNEPMRVETVSAQGSDRWAIGLVGTQTERFRKVTLTAADLETLTIIQPGFTYDGDGQLLRLGLQAYSLGIAYEFDPYFGLSISRVDPLPHQLEAVYDYLLKLARVRFLLDEDAYADVKSIREAMEQRRAPFYLRRTKEAMVYFPERLFVVEIKDADDPILQDPGVLGNLSPVNSVPTLPPVAYALEPDQWLNEKAFMPFLQEVRSERLAEVERIAAHVELSLTELLQKADEEIGRAATEVEQKVQGAAGRLTQAETRHGELLARREKRRQELERERSLSLQAVERFSSVMILSHPERETPEIRRLRPDAETEEVAMGVAMVHERARGCQVYDVHEKNLGYDITSLDPGSGELRLIEVKGLGQASGSILLTPNERWVAEDRPDCYWLYVVTSCKSTPQLQTPIKDPARLKWHEVIKVSQYYLAVNALAGPMEVKETPKPYGGSET